MHQLKSLNYRHHAIMDWILANPDRTLGECAKALGFSQSWVSIIISSDLFRDEFERRRAGLEEQENREIVGKLRRVAKGALDRIAERIDAGEDVSDQLLIQGTSAAMKALGYGGGPARPAVNINNNYGNQQINNGTVDEGTMREAQEIYRRTRGLNGAPAEQKALPNDEAATTDRRVEAPLVPSTERV